MTNTSYLAIKGHIFTNLKKIDGVLPADQIDKEIENIKQVITTFGNETFGLMISYPNLQCLNDVDWIRMRKEFETHFDVAMSPGILIQSKAQQKRDNAWWSSLEKQQIKKYYWERYKNYLYDSLPPEVVKILDEDTDVVMNNIEDPKLAEFSRYGMVVGHVQSGKTGNYSGLICKAADAGYKFIVVIAGSMNNLRNQTQERLNESFVGQTDGVQVGVGKGDSDKNYTPFSLTTVKRDFNQRDADRTAQSTSFESINGPVLLVIKKNTKTLSSVIGWLEKQYKNKISEHAMLVIDDESDNASVNTKEDEDPTAINKGIRKLLNLFNKSAYVAYTATPYANIFIDHEVNTNDYGQDLFPRDFIYALDAPTNYFGARKIFLDSQNKHLVAVSDYEEFIPVKHKKDHVIEALPISMSEAIYSFLINVAIRHLRGYGKSHNSMLIHATRFTLVHQSLAGKITEFLEYIKNDLLAYGSLKHPENQSEEISTLKSVFNKNFKGLEFNWDSTLLKLVEIIETFIIREVHQSSKLKLEYRKDVATNAIVIGGTSVARGFTLEGLSISYFLRNTVFYDTLMQMGRWFGYRTGYEDLCRIYMPAEKINQFAEIIEETEDLMAEFKKMSENNCTPEEWGLSMKRRPDSVLQITARNKLKNAKDYIFSMNLDGSAKETSILSEDRGDIEHNIRLIQELVKSMRTNTDEVAGQMVWKDVDRKIVADFFNRFKFYQPNDELGLFSRMPIGFIKNYLKERSSNWDIALYSGKGLPFNITPSVTINKEIRSMIVKTNGNYEANSRQISSGNAEAVGLSIEDRKLVKSDRKMARELMTRPLLRLHIIQPDFKDRKDMPDTDTLAAIGMSFPTTSKGGNKSEDDKVMLKINSVYYKNVLRELELEEEGDDD